MSDFLSLRETDRIARESAPHPGPGIVTVLREMILAPATTLREALAYPNQAYALVLAGLGGVYWMLNFAVIRALGEDLAPAMLAATIVLLGIPAGVAYLYALSILIHWSCDILGGDPTRAKVRASLAYAGVPGIIALVLFGIPKVLVFGQSLFMPERTWLSSNPVLVWGLWFGDALCFAWALYLVVKALKMMNGFTAGRAVLAAALPLVPIGLIGSLFVLIAWSGIFFAPPAF
jgi:hypothetical protein